jgi:hypothetical protein
MRLFRLLGLAILLVTPFALGCSSSLKGKIEGTKWSSLEMTLKNGMKAPAGFMTIEFRTDGVVVMKVGLPGGPSKTSTGKYSLGWGDRVTMNMDEAVDDKGTKTLADRVVINGDRMTMTDPDGSKFEFERVKEEAKPK